MLLREKTAASVTLALSQCYDINKRSRQLTNSAVQIFQGLSVRKKFGNCRGLAIRMSRQAPDHALFSRLQEPGKSHIASSAVMQSKFIDSPYIEDRILLTSFHARGISRTTTVTSLTPLRCLPHNHCRARLLCSRRTWRLEESAFGLIQTSHQCMSGPMPS